MQQPCRHTHDHSSCLDEKQNTQEQKTGTKGQRGTHFARKDERARLRHPHKQRKRWHLCSRSLSLSTSLALPLSLIRGHAWNHLVSQKTGPNDEEVECNVRSAKRGERKGEGREKMEHNVQACNLKSSAQKVSLYRFPDLNFEVQIVPKCFPKGPSEILRTNLGQSLAP